MRSKIIIALACLCMLFLISSAAFANSAEYTVYVGGAKMTASEDGSKVSYYVNGTDGGQGTIYENAPSEWNAKLWYDTENKVLTLSMNGLDAEGVADNANTLGAGIYSSYPIAFVLNGESKVEGVGYKTNVYGIYADSITISESTSGTLYVTTTDIKGNCYGIYATGNLNVLSGTLNAQAGSSTSGYGYNSYGIYTAGAVNIGGEGLLPVVESKAGDSYAESCGIYGHKGITIDSGKVTAVSAYAKSGYSDGMLSNRSTITINGGTVVASSSGSSGGMSSGICANYLHITGGSTTATGGNTYMGEQQSAGVYTNYDIEVSGGQVKAIGQEAFGDVSFGMNSWRGDITISGDSVVYAHGGPASYSVGLCCERRSDGNNRLGGDITIKDNAKVYSSTDDSNTIRVYSYGMFVGGNLLIEGSPYVESIAGPVNDTEITGKLFGREKRSFGIYLADDVYDSTNTNYVEGGHKDTAERHSLQITGGTVISKTLDSDNGNLPDAEGDLMFNRSYAVVFYDVDKIDFFNSDQTNDKWYQWKINELDDMTKSTVTKYPDAEKWQSTTQYFHVEPISEEEPEQPPVDPEEPSVPIDPDETVEQDKLNNDDSSNTGDEFNMAVMLAIVMLTAASMAVVIAEGRRRG